MDTGMTCDDDTGAIDDTYNCMAAAYDSADCSDMAGMGAAQTAASECVSGGGGGDGEGACTNDADMAIIDDEEVDVPQITQDAAFGCLAAEDMGTCTAEDVSGQTGLSTACVACYAEQVTCAMEFCASTCIAAPEGDDCTDCRTDNCIGLFEPCSGIASTS